MKTFARYFRRYAMRSAIFGWRMIAIMVAVWSMAMIKQVDPSGTSVVAVILIYGIYAITEAVKSRTPPVHVIKCDVASFEHGAILSIPKESLEVAVEKIVGAEIIKRASAQ